MNSRSASLDILKLVLAFLVVALHIFPVSKMKGIPGLISYEIASGITRIAVPTFFIISGYLLRNKLNDWNYIKKYCIRILLLYLVWQLIYLPDLFYHHHIKWFGTKELVLKLIYGYWHLWYLLATVFGVLLLYFSRNWQPKLKLITVLLLILMGYLFQLGFKLNIFQHIPVLKSIYEIIGTSRNAFFLAFPFLLLGTLFDSWKSWFKKVKLLLGLCLLGLLLESYCYYSLKLGAMDFFVFLLPISLLLLQLAVQNNVQMKWSIPATLSLGIYLLHPYMIRLVYEFLPQKTIGFISVKYFIICGITLVLWFVVDRINRKFPYFF
ncbi:acyltransferase family protein [Flavobacterium sp.]|uniref:acyltransferase family protein n=1 Tax=Flavobacterium sp. TaxID=239 RepID=UPI0028BE4DC1|nr:acyltransferase family protein [Flavobacterium sp.]